MTTAGPVVSDAGGSRLGELLEYDLELLTRRGLTAEVGAQSQAQQQDRANYVLPMLAGARSLIDTSFSMGLGETVVVGTSRLQGDTALIVLLTAVSRAEAAPRGVRLQ